MRKLLAVAALVVAVAGLTACSKSGDHDDAESTTPPTTAGSTVGSGGSGGSDSGGSGTNGALAEYCTKWNEIQTKYADTFKEVQAPPTLDPTNPQATLQQLQTVGAKLLAPMQEFQAVAPPEIKSDVDALVSGLQALADANPAGIASAGAAMNTAGTNIGKFLSAHCAASGSATSTDTGAGAGTGTGTATGPG